MRCNLIRKAWDREVSPFRQRREKRRCGEEGRLGGSCSNQNGKLGSGRRGEGVGSTGNGTQDLTSPVLQGDRIGFTCKGEIVNPDVKVKKKQKTQYQTGECGFKV